MQNTKLIELLTQESTTLEFKRELSSKSHEGLACTICAFANTAGGDILIGVEDKTKHIVGVSNPQELEEKITNIIADRITPKIIPTIEILNHEQNSVLRIHIYPNSPSRPYYLESKGKENGTYIRVGSSTKPADRQMIEELERSGRRKSFEEEPLTELTFEAIDFGEIVNCFKPIRQLKEGDLISFGLTAKFQDKLVPTNAGMILFGKERERYFPNAKVKAARFFGLKRGEKIVDSRDIESYPVIAVQEAIDFVKKHANYESEIRSSSQDEQWNIKRSEQWNIPIIAVREAIINAILHADYSQKGGCIRLYIYQDRIEIENPGLLVTGIAIEDIKKGISKLRNPIIGNIFNKLRLSEHYGSGINKIIQECEKFGLKTPIFEEIEGAFFRVTIHTTPQVIPDLDDIDNAIIDALRYQYFTNPKKGLSTKDITSITTLSQRTTRQHLLSLVESGFVSEIAKGPTDPKKKYFLKEEYTKIPMFISSNKIRQNLQEILDSGFLRSEQKIKLIEQMLEIPANAIPEEWQWQGELPGERRFHGNFNAYAFAFGLTNFAAYIKKISKGSNDRRSFASSLFIKDYMAHKGLRELNYPHKDCLVLYLDKDENPVHAGIVEDTLSITVRSKWGTFPVIFKHKLRDIPTSYGSLIKFYDPIDAQDAYDFFKTWSV